MMSHGDPGETGAEEQGKRTRTARNSWLPVLALATQLGFSVACPMVLFIGGGAWLDNRIGWGPWLLFVGIFLGVATAGGLLYQIAALPSRRRAGREAEGAVAPYKMDGTATPPGGEKPRSDRAKRNGS